MKHGVDILVATPGRLLDLVQQKHIRLDAVQVFIVDEADRMLDMGFIRDVRKIVAHLPARAAVDAVLRHHARRHRQAGGRHAARSPERIEVTPRARPPTASSRSVYYVPMPQKRQLLSALLKDEAMNRVIVFTRTKHGANRVAEHLSKTGVGRRSHSRQQVARMRASAPWKLFRSGKARVLVATDIAARGIDIDDITHVINFELPNEPESYVHRIGRTARAGGQGIAISFCDSSERDYLRDIERLIHTKITALPHDLPELTEAQKAQAEEPRRPHGHRHGKPGHKFGGHKPGGGPAKKRNGSRAHWNRKRDAA